MENRRPANARAVTMRPRARTDMRVGTASRRITVTATTKTVSQNDARRGSSLQAAPERFAVQPRDGGECDQRGTRKEESWHGRVSALFRQIDNGQDQVGRTPAAGQE